MKNLLLLGVMLLVSACTVQPVSHVYQPPFVHRAPVYVAPHVWSRPRHWAPHPMPRYHAPRHHVPRYHNRHHRYYRSW
jgi:hypothetical protein